MYALQVHRIAGRTRCWIVGCIRCWIVVGQSCLEPSIAVVVATLAVGSSVFATATKVSAARCSVVCITAHLATSTFSAAHLATSTISAHLTAHAALAPAWSSIANIASHLRGASSS